MRWVRVDLTFHRIIMEASGNRRLLKLISDMQVLSNTSLNIFNNDSGIALRLIVRKTRTRWRVIYTNILTPVAEPMD